jgi:hypothetical protein
MKKEDINKKSKIMLNKVKDLLSEYVKDEAEEVWIELVDTKYILSILPIGTIEWDEGHKAYVLSFFSAVHPLNAAKLLLTLVNNKILNIKLGESFYIKENGTTMYYGEEADREYWHDVHMDILANCPFKNGQVFAEENHTIH